MSSLPSAIFFVNGDLTYPPVPPVFIGADPSVSELTTLQTQLFINDTMTKAEFDARVAADPNYPTIVHLQNLRILVILPTFHDLTNRQYADVVIFLHQGLADVEKNRFGPPGQNYEVQRLTIYQLLRAAHSHNVVTLPFGVGMNCCNACGSPFYCDTCHTFSGISICTKCECRCKCFCNIHAPNCENEYHNRAFIHRK